MEPKNKIEIKSQIKSHEEETLYIHNVTPLHYHMFKLHVQCLTFLPQSLDLLSLYHGHCQTPES